MGFMPLDLQERLFFAENVSFVFSISLNMLAMGFLIKQTSQNQAIIRNYLLIIQVLVIITDVVLGLLSEGMPLFPEWGGYCCGWLCRKAFPAVAFALIIALLSNTGVVIVSCCLYRHQTILFDPSPYKMSTRKLRNLRFSILAGFNIAPIIICLRSVEGWEVESQIDQNGLAWIRERNCPYSYVLPREARLSLAYGITLRSKRSSASTTAIRKSLAVLFVQLVVPMLLIVFPSTIIFLGLALQTLISFETSLSMYYLVHFHSIGHNLILLSITTTYRRAIMNFLRCSSGAGSVVHSKAGN